MFHIYTHIQVCILFVYPILYVQLRSPPPTDPRIQVDHLWRNWGSSFSWKFKSGVDTVDGQNPANHQRWWLSHYLKSEKSPTGPTERTPKPENLIARSQLPERGPVGFGPIQFLMDIGQLNHPRWLFGIWTSINSMMCVERWCVILGKNHPSLRGKTPAKW